MNTVGDVVETFVFEPGQKRPVPLAVVIRVFKPVRVSIRFEWVGRIVTAVPIVVGKGLLPETALFIHRRDG